MATGVDEPPLRSDESVSCPRCGAFNPPRTIACYQCGQDLRLVMRAVQQRQTDTASPPRRAASLRVAFGLGTALAVLLAALVGWQSFQRGRAEQAALEHYLNGVWAAEVGRWDVAEAEFEAAGIFRDAAQRRAQAEANLHQVEDRYRDALTARADGRPWDAAFLLQQVVKVIPDYESAQRFLEDARRRVGPVLFFRRVANALAADGTEVVLATADGGAEQVLAKALAEGVDARLSPDGRWLVYEALDNSQSSLWLTEIATGQQVALVESSRDTWARWSPDSNQLLYGWEGEQGWSVFLRGLATGKGRRLLRGADIATGDFSPKGSWFTLWERRRNEWSLFLGETESEVGPARLVEDADSIGRLDWAPDDEQLAFGYFLDGRWYLYRLEPGKALPSELAPGAEYAWAAYQPEGDAFALWRWQEPLGTLSIVSRKSGQERELLRGPADAWTRWSADGRWLAAGEWNGRNWRLHLWDMHEALESPITLTDEADEVEALFAGDSRHLLLRVWRNDQWTVAVRNLESGAESLLLADVPFAQAQWVADDAHVLLWWNEAPSVENPAPMGGSLAVAEAATGRRITLSEGLNAVQGSFARDGSKMALTLQPVGSTASVWVANLDGSGLLELDPRSYRVYWSTIPWEFGPPLPQ